MTNENVELRDLPPSAKLVYKVLEHEGRITQKRLVEETHLTARTVRDAIQELKDLDVVEEGIYIYDARQSLYKIKDGKYRA